MEYLNKHHPLPEKYRVGDMDDADEDDRLDGMLRFEKIVVMGGGRE